MVTSGAMFAFIFGAGNLILPPQLGAHYPDSWFLTALGFSVTSIVFPVLGFVAHARNQRGIHGLASPMGNVFSWMFPLLIYLIAVLLPSPRTASVTYEIGVKPLFDFDASLFSLLYFTGVFLVGWYRSRLLEFVGKYLNPLLVVAILALVGGALFLPFGEGTDITEPAFAYGVIEGYQTYDALASMVIGGVILVSLKVGRPDLGKPQIRKIVSYSGVIAGTGLLLVYWGLIFGGTRIPLEGDEISRTELLRLLSFHSLGAGSTYLLSALVGLACFSTACGISIGAADFVAELPGRRSRLYFRISLAIICLSGWLVGMWEADTIVQWGYPVLLFIYPATVVLIVLTVIPESRLQRFWFRLTLWTCVLFSIPDVALYLNPEFVTDSPLMRIPGADLQLGWVLPSLAALVTGLFVSSLGKKSG